MNSGHVEEAASPPSCGGAIPKVTRQPSAPPSMEEVNIPDERSDAWHDTKELVSVKEGEWL